MKLQDQPFEVLIVLLEQYPQPIARDELRKHIWGENTFVEFDHGLSNAIGRIRSALGDSADNPRFIATLPKRGYRFIAPLERIGDAVGTAAPEVGAASVPGGVVAARSRRPPFVLYAALLGLLAAALSARSLFRPAPAALTYTQITNYHDPTFVPVLSPDGRTVAFMRGREMSFPSVGQIYSMFLASGDTVQLTDDAVPKYGLAFTPDGTHISYTEADPAHGWNTLETPLLRGESKTVVENAAGLTWLDAHHVLFSQITSGLHMGLVTATDTRSDVKSIYLPEHERGMVHYAYASPDRKWTLAVEMGPTGAWQRCRLVPLDGHSAGSQVGPNGPCTAAAWSPDGKQMYFTAYVAGSTHLWRQVFPDGDVEQLTFGPAEEAGIAMSPDGHSIFTSVGMNESGVWMHEPQGERLLSGEGYASQLSFSRNGTLLDYLLHRVSPTLDSELWATDLASGKREPVVQGLFLTAYDVSDDGTQVVFAAGAEHGRSQIWLANHDHHSAPRLLADSGEDTPFFGPDGDICFRMSDGRANHLFKMKTDGTQRVQVMADSITNLRGVSPDRQWALVLMPVDAVSNAAVEAVPVRGGTPRRICPAICMAKWVPDGSRFYVAPILERASGRALMIPVPAGEVLPQLPTVGVTTVDDASLLPGSRVIDFSAGQEIVPGPTENAFAYTKTVVHRNILQIHLR